MLPEVKARPFENFLPELAACSTARTAASPGFGPGWASSGGPRAVAEAGAQGARQFDQATVDDLVQSAHDRGYQLGEAVAVARAEADATRQRAETELALASARYADLVTYSNQFAEQLDQGLRRIEREHSERIAALLRAMVMRHFKSELMREVLSAVDKATSLRPAVSVSVGGPPELADRLAVELERRGIAFARDDGGSRDLTVVLDGTHLRMELGQWLDKLEGLLE